MRRFFKIPVGRPLLVLVILGACTITAPSSVALAQENFESYTEVTGVLYDGTRYMMRVPSHWNGTLIRDLDYATAANSDRYLAPLKHGYAVAGTARHERRWVGFYDPVREIRHLDTVLDRFVEEFREPDRVIQYGCSGGGHVALAMADDFPDRIDGVIATGAHTPVWLLNTALDGWFALKALIAPDLQIVDLPSEPNLRPQHIPLVYQWRQAIHRAQQTPEGRARIALALTVGQWPDWVSSTIPNPDRDDVEQLQHSMYLSALQHATPGYIGGVSRYMFENPAGLPSGQLSWNTGVDYRQLFENGNTFQRQAVRALYQEAGLDLDGDLQRINDFPRIEADPAALDYWSEAGRTTRGEPQVPVFRMHAIGDYIVPVSPVQGYTQLIREHGREDLYRVAMVEAATHCGFSGGEVSAAIETLNRRLDTGSWGSTGPEALNRLAEELGWDGTPARFIDFDDYANPEYNRTWVPE